MLGSAYVIAFVPTRDSKKARTFYEKTLGLKFVSEDPFALVFEAQGVMIRIANVSNVRDFKPAPFTILGWEVRSAEKTVE
jgi:catechol 2,3-dioxygenase-like lactoylglutathione lyase family enzyme